MYNIQTMVGHHMDERNMYPPNQGRPPLPPQPAPPGYVPMPVAMQPVPMQVMNVPVQVSNTALNTRRGPWSPLEDKKLLDLIAIFGPTNWVRISNSLATRTPKQCRERYHQNLKPSLNRSPITVEEGELIESLVAKYGKKWAEISRHLNGRSDNAIKNWWNGGANRKRRASLANEGSVPRKEKEKEKENDEKDDDDKERSIPTDKDKDDSDKTDTKADTKSDIKTDPHDTDTNMEVANDPRIRAGSVGYGPRAYGYGVGGHPNIPYASYPAPTHPLSQTYPHPSQLPQISFNTSMFKQPESSPAVTLPPLSKNNRSASFDVNSHHPGQGSGSLASQGSGSVASQGSGSVASQGSSVNQGPTGPSGPLAPSLPGVSLPPISSSNKRRLLDENRRHSSANSLYSNSLGSHPNLSSAYSLGQVTPPNYGSPLLLSSQVSRDNSVSHFDLTGNSSRRSSIAPDLFPNPLKEHKRKSSHNSFSPVLTPSTRFSVSSQNSGLHHSSTTSPLNTKGHAWGSTGSLRRDDEEEEKTKIAVSSLID